MCVVLRNIGTLGGELPTLECDGCDMRFSIVWDRNPVYEQPEHCPFCGEEVVEIVWEEEE